MLFGTHFTQIVKYNIEQNISPALFGEPGIGKTSFFENLAHEMDTEFFVLPCNMLSDKADLTAPRLVPREGGGFSQEFYPHQVIQDAIEYARANPTKLVPLLMDEINRANEGITSSALSLQTLRRIGREDLPDNMRILIAGNDKGNITALDSASLTRFAIFNVEPDAGVFMEIMGDKLNPMIRKVLTLNPSYIFMKPQVGDFLQESDDDDTDGSINAAVNDLTDDGEDMMQFTTPRTIDYLNRFLNSVAAEDLNSWIHIASRRSGANGTMRELSVLQEVIESYTGDTAFTAAIVQEVIEQSMAPATAGNQARPVITKPVFYDALMSQATIQAIDDFVVGLSPTERSMALVFALQDQADTSIAIRSLVAGFGFENDGVTPENLHSTAINALVELGQGSLLNENNLNAMLNSNAPFVPAIRNMLSMLSLI